MALDRRGCRIGLDHAVSGGGEPLGERPANELFVVDDENGRCGHEGVQYTRRDRARSTDRVRSSRSNGLATMVAPSAAASSATSRVAKAVIRITGIAGLCWRMKDRRPRSTESG